VELIQLRAKKNKRKYFCFFDGGNLGTPGYGKVPVWDRGGAIKGNRLDVFFDTHVEAINWGIKYLEVKEVK